MVYVAINSDVVDNKCYISTGMKNACYLSYTSPLIQLSCIATMRSQEACAYDPAGAKLIALRTY